MKTLRAISGTAYCFDGRKRTRSKAVEHARGWVATKMGLLDILVLMKGLPVHWANRSRKWIQRAMKGSFSEATIQDSSLGNPSRRKMDEKARRCGWVLMSRSRKVRPTDLWLDSRQPRQLGVIARR